MISQKWSPFPRWNILIKLLLQYLLIATMQTEVHSKFCPASCECTFADNMEDTKARCDFGNTTVILEWGNIYRPLLIITCQGTNYTCNNLPQFNIRHNYAKLKVVNCASSILRCVNNIFSQPTTISSFIAINMDGDCVAEDFKYLDKVENVSLFLTKDNSDVAATIIDSLPSLWDIFIFDGNLKKITNKMHQPSLRHLSLHNNQMMELPAFNGLKNLLSLHITENHIEHLKAENFQGLEALEKLSVKKSYLKNIDPNTFSKTPKLLFLDLTENELGFLPNGLLDNLKYLTRILITKNKANLTLDTHLFARLQQSVKFIDLVDSNINSLPEDLFNGPNSIEHLSLRGNKIEFLPEKIFWNLSSLKTIFLNYNNIKMLPDGVFTKMKNLETIYLNRNNITSLSGDLFAFNSKLKKIYLNYNNIISIDVDIFKGTRLRTLNLSFNKLQRIVGHKEFSWTTQTLDLSNNNLREFEDWFGEVADLEYLDLSDNNIETIKESQIFAFKFDSEIILENNNISYIIQDISEAQMSAAQGNFYVYLYNNPLKCDCSLVKTLNNWNKYGILDDFEAVTCANGDLLSKLDIDVDCNKTQPVTGLMNQI